jgi:hypothetical protein
MQALALIIQPASKEKVERILQEHLPHNMSLEFYFCIGLHQAWQQRHTIRQRSFEVLYVATPLITSGGRTSFSRILALMCKPFRSKAFLVDETGQIAHCSWGRALWYDIPNLSIGALAGLMTVYVSLVLVWIFRQYLRWSN